MTTSPFDSYRPPDEGRRKRRRSSVRGAVTGAARDLAKGGQRGWLNRDGGGRREAAAVPDAEVHLTLASPNGDVSTYRATPGALGHFFEADAPLAQAGRWHLTLGVTSAQGREEVAFAWRVFTPLQLGLGLAVIVAALTAVMALLGFGRLDTLRHLAGRQRWGQQVRSAKRSLEYRRPRP